MPLVQTLRVAFKFETRYQVQRQRREFDSMFFQRVCTSHEYNIGIGFEDGTREIYNYILLMRLDASFLTIAFTIHIFFNLHFRKLHGYFFKK